MSKWKTDQGVYYTKSLFYETVSSEDKPHVQYTLKQEDHNGYPSLRKLYLEEMDPTEYRFANKYLGGWDHFTKLKESDWFMEYLENWREELEVKLKSLAYERVMNEAQNELSKNKLLANKYLIETVKRIQKNEDLGSKETKGRPSKESVDKKAFELAQQRFDVRKDVERILNKDLN